MPDEPSTREVTRTHDTGERASILRTLSLTDASEQGDYQKWVDSDFHQISSGNYRGSCTILSSDRIHVVHERQNQLVHKTGFMPKHTCTVSMAIENNPSLRFSHFHNPMASWMFFLPEETEFDIKIPGDIETIYVCLEQERLMKSARVLNERFWESPPKDLHAFHTPHTGELARYLGLLLKNARHADIDLNKFLMDALLSSLNSSTQILTGNTSEYHSCRRANQLVKTAREFIDACQRTGDVPSIVELCAQLCVSERTLQYAFHRVMQLSPIAYLRILRLNKVRSALRAATSPNATVTQIAMNWGFLHLGKFSQDYRRMFGELPSETLAKSKQSL